MGMITPSTPASRAAMMAPYWVFHGARRNGTAEPSEMAWTMPSSSAEELVGECCMSMTSQSKPERLSISAINGLPEPTNAPHKGRSPCSILSLKTVNDLPPFFLVVQALLASEPEPYFTQRSYLFTVNNIQSSSNCQL